MRIVRQGGKSETYGGRFTGRVELEMLQEAEAEGRPDVARVHFHDGAVTNWHSHPGGQHLYLVEGRGRMGMPDGEHELAPGDVILFPDGPEGAHKVTNRGEGIARIAILSNKGDPCVAVYPDSGKVGVWPLNKIFRLEDAVDYWDGEV